MGDTLASKLQQLQEVHEKKFIGDAEFAKRVQLLLDNFTGPSRNGSPAVSLAVRVHM